MPPSSVGASPDDAVGDSDPRSVSRRPKSSSATALPTALFPTAFMTPLARSPLLVSPPPVTLADGSTLTKPTSLAKMRALSGDKAQQLAVEAVRAQRTGDPCADSVPG